jgi:hypothetical protein
MPDRGGRGLRRANLEDWNLDGFDAERAKTVAELAGLVRGARDEDAPSGKRQRDHQAAPPGKLPAAASNGPAPWARSISAASCPKETGSVFWSGA